MSSDIQIIILNAPPMSGKDDIAEYLSVEYGAIHLEVKELLFQVAVRAAGITRPLWDALYTRDYKERPTPYLQIDGERVSPREWMIHCSENLIKPLFGKDAFGKAAVQDLIKRDLRPGSVVVFSDGGFIEELFPLARHAQENGGELLLARIERRGYGWGKDSRSYLHLKENNVPGYEKDFLNKEGCLGSCADEIWAWATEIHNQEDNE